MIVEHVPLRREVKDIIIADIVLITAFTLTLSGGIFDITPKSVGGVLLLLPMVALGVTLSFVLHELMHKYVAQHYGAIAGFRTSTTGLLITLVTGLFGFLIGIPGATMIYAHNFTKKENGIVSLAGPLTNFAIFAVFLAITVVANPVQGGYLSQTAGFVISISLLLAFFNMLPIYPLDGSKVLRWNPTVYVITMGVIFVLMYAFTAIPLSEIAVMLVFALFFSMLYKGMLNF